MRASLAALVLAAAVPGFAQAQPVSDAAGPDTYLLVHLGALQPRGDLKDLDTGYSVGGAFGARFSRHLAVEAGLAYQAAHMSGGVKFSEVPISVSLVARLPFKQVELAAYAGPDLHMAWLDPGGSNTASDVAFGGHLGARIGFNLWPTMLVGFDVRGDKATATFRGADVAIDSVRMAITLQSRFQ